MIFLLLLLAAPILGAPYLNEATKQEEQTMVDRMLSPFSGMIGPLFRQTNTELEISPATPLCYHMGIQYEEGEQIMTDEPCLNCTCLNGMLMCYLKVCPFSRPITKGCTIEKKPGECCPTVTCPMVPVSLQIMQMGSTTVSPSTTEESTALEPVRPGPNVKGCFVDDKFYGDGAMLPIDSEQPCSRCYCIRNQTSCIMQQCTLHINQCQPVYVDGVCCPIKYDCEMIMPATESGVTEPPTTTFISTIVDMIITTEAPVIQPGCNYKGNFYPDGEVIVTPDPCQHCYCLHNETVCAVEECKNPADPEMVNCTAVNPEPGTCCPQAYNCDTDETLLETTMTPLTISSKIGEETSTKPELDTSTAVTVDEPTTGLVQEMTTESKDDTTTAIPKDTDEPKTEIPSEVTDSPNTITSDTQRESTPMTTSPTPLRPTVEETTQTSDDKKTEEPEMQVTTVSPITEELEPETSDSVSDASSTTIEPSVPEEATYPDTTATPIVSGEKKTTVDMQDVSEGLETTAEPGTVPLSEVTDPAITGTSDTQRESTPMVTTPSPIIHTDEDTTIKHDDQQTEDPEIQAATVTPNPEELETKTTVSIPDSTLLTTKPSVSQKEVTDRDTTTSSIVTEAEDTTVGIEESTERPEGPGTPGSLVTDKPEVSIPSEVTVTSVDTTEVAVDEQELTIHATSPVPLEKVTEAESLPTTGKAPIEVTTITYIIEESTLSLEDKINDSDPTVSPLEVDVDSTQEPETTQTPVVETRVSQDPEVTTIGKVIDERTSEPPISVDTSPDEATTIPSDPTASSGTTAGASEEIAPTESTPGELDMDQEVEKIDTTLAPMVHPETIDTTTKKTTEDSIVPDSVGTTEVAEDASEPSVLETTGESLMVTEGADSINTEAPEKPYVPSTTEISSDMTEIADLSTTDDSIKVSLPDVTTLAVPSEETTTEGPGKESVDEVEPDHLTAVTEPSEQIVTDDGTKPTTEESTIDTWPTKTPVGITESSDTETTETLAVVTESFDSESTNVPEAGMDPVESITTSSPLEPESVNLTTESQDDKATTDSATTAKSTVSISSSPVIETDSTSVAIDKDVFTSTQSVIDEITSSIVEEHESSTLLSDSDIATTHDPSDIDSEDKLTTVSEDGEPKIETRISEPDSLTTTPMSDIDVTTEDYVGLTTVQTDTSVPEVPGMQAMPAGTDSPTTQATAGDCVENGEVYLNGDVIKPKDPCQESCLCLNGTMRCEIVSCPSAPPPFRQCQPITSASECCPSYECPTLDNVDGDGTCLVNNITYANGDYMESEDICTDCYCVRGKVVCAKLECEAPAANCYPSEHRSTSCCPSKYICDQDETEATTPFSVEITTGIDEEDKDTELIGDTTVISPAEIEQTTSVPEPVVDEKKPITEIPKPEDTTENNDSVISVTDTSIEPEPISFTSTTTKVTEIDETSELSTALTTDKPATSVNESATEQPVKESLSIVTSTTEMELETTDSSKVQILSTDEPLSHVYESTTQDSQGIDLEETTFDTLSEVQQSTEDPQTTTSETKFETVMTSEVSVTEGTMVVTTETFEAQTTSSKDIEDDVSISTVPERPGNITGESTEPIVTDKPSVIVSQTTQATSNITDDSTSIITTDEELTTSEPEIFTDTTIKPDTTEDEIDPLVTESPSAGVTDQEPETSTDLTSEDTDFTTVSAEETTDASADGKHTTSDPGAASSEPPVTQMSDEADKTTTELLTTLSPVDKEIVLEEDDASSSTQTSTLAGVEMPSETTVSTVVDESTDVPVSEISEVTSTEAQTKPLLPEQTSTPISTDTLEAMESTTKIPSIEVETEITFTDETTASPIQSLVTDTQTDKEVTSLSPDTEFIEGVVTEKEISETDTDLPLVSVTTRPITTTTEDSSVTSDHIPETMEQTSPAIIPTETEERITMEPITLEVSTTESFDESSVATDIPTGTEKTTTVSELPAEEKSPEATTSVAIKPVASTEETTEGHKETTVDAESPDSDTTVATVTESTAVDFTDSTLVDSSTKIIPTTYPVIGVDTDTTTLPSALVKPELTTYMPGEPSEKGTESPIDEEISVIPPVEDTTPYFSISTLDCLFNGTLYMDNEHIPPLPCEDSCKCENGTVKCIRSACQNPPAVQNCTTIIKDGACCPEYDCMTETPLEKTYCAKDNQLYEHGAAVQSEDICTLCQCLYGEIVCAVLECTPPSAQCTPLYTRASECCPDKYECETPSIDVTTTTSIDEQTTEILEAVTEKIEVITDTDVSTAKPLEPEETGITVEDTTPSDDKLPMSTPSIESDSQIKETSPTTESESLVTTKVPTVIEEADTVKPEQSTEISKEETETSTQIYKETEATTYSITNITSQAVSDKESTEASIDVTTESVQVVTSSLFQTTTKPQETDEITETDSVTDSQAVDAAETTPSLIDQDSSTKFTPVGEIDLVTDKAVTESTTEISKETSTSDFVEIALDTTEASDIGTSESPKTLDPKIGEAPETTSSSSSIDDETTIDGVEVTKSPVGATDEEIEKETETMEEPAQVTKEPLTVIDQTSTESVTESSVDAEQTTESTKETLVEEKETIIDVTDAPVVVTDDPDYVTDVVVDLTEAPKNETAFSVTPEVIITVTEASTSVTDSPMQATQLPLDLIGGVENLTEILIDETKMPTMMPDAPVETTILPIDDTKTTSRPVDGTQAPEDITDSETTVDTAGVSLDMTEASVEGTESPDLVSSTSATTGSSEIHLDTTQIPDVSQVNGTESPIGVAEFPNGTTEVTEEEGGGPGVTTEISFQTTVAPVDVDVASNVTEDSMDIPKASEAPVTDEEMTTDSTGETEITDVPISTPDPSIEAAEEVTDDTAEHSTDIVSMPVTDASIGSTEDPIIETESSDGSKIDVTDPTTDKEDSTTTSSVESTNPSTEIPLVPEVVTSDLVDPATELPLTTDVPDVMSTNEPPDTVELTENITESQTESSKVDTVEGVTVPIDSDIETTEGPTVDVQATTELMKETEDPITIPDIPSEQVLPVVTDPTVISEATEKETSKLETTISPEDKEDGPTTTSPTSPEEPPKLSCLYFGTEYQHKEPIKPASRCEDTCFCNNGTRTCYLKPCPTPPSRTLNCVAVSVAGECCPTYTCEPEVSIPGEGCVLNKTLYNHNETVPTGSICSDCRCTNGNIVCAHLECIAPRDNCVAVVHRANECCPSQYECTDPITPVTMDILSVIKETTQAPVQETTFKPEETTKSTSYPEVLTTGTTRDATLDQQTTQPPTDDLEITTLQADKGTKIEPQEATPDSTAATYTESDPKEPVETTEIPHVPEVSTTDTTREASVDTQTTQPSVDDTDTTTLQTDQESTSASTAATDTGSDPKESIGTTNAPSVSEILTTDTTQEGTGESQTTQSTVEESEITTFPTDQETAIQSQGTTPASTVSDKDTKHPERTTEFPTLLDVSTTDITQEATIDTQTILAMTDTDTTTMQIDQETTIQSQESTSVSTTKRVTVDDTKEPEEVTEVSPGTEVVTKSTTKETSLDGQTSPLPTDGFETTTLQGDEVTTIKPKETTQAPISIAEDVTEDDTKEPSFVSTTEKTSITMPHSGDTISTRIRPEDDTATELTLSEDKVTTEEALLEDKATEKPTVIEHVTEQKTPDEETTKEHDTFTEKTVPETDQTTKVPEGDLMTEKLLPEPEATTEKSNLHTTPSSPTPIDTLYTAPENVTDYPPFPPYPGSVSSTTESAVALSPGACLFDGKVYVSAQQIPRDDPCDFCFCFRGDIICLQQSCPPPIPGCYEEAIPGFCCPRYECPVKKHMMNVTTTEAPAGQFQQQSLDKTSRLAACEIGGKFYDVGEEVQEANTPCLSCKCGEAGYLDCLPLDCGLGYRVRRYTDFKLR